MPAGGSSIDVASVEDLVLAENHIIRGDSGGNGEAADFYGTDEPSSHTFTLTPREGDIYCKVGTGGFSRMYQYGPSATWDLLTRFGATSIVNIPASEQVLIPANRQALTYGDVPIINGGVLIQGPWVMEL